MRPSLLVCSLLSLSLVTLSCLALQTEAWRLYTAIPSCHQLHGLPLDHHIMSPTDENLPGTLKTPVRLILSSKVSRHTLALLNAHLPDLPVYYVSCHLRRHSLSHLISEPGCESRIHYNSHLRCLFMHGETHLPKFSRTNGRARNNCDTGTVICSKSH